MSILVFIQASNDGKPLKSSLCALKAAEMLASGTPISGVILGVGAKSAAESMKAFGLKEIFYSEDQKLEKYFAPCFEAALMKAVDHAQASVVIGASTSCGKDLFPRIAARLDAGQASDVVMINSDGTFRRPMYAGDVIADVSITTTKKVITVRSSAFSAAEPVGGSAVVVELVGVPFPNGVGEVVGYEIAKAERPELGDAEVVVSGGRALQSSENFEKIIFPLADALGAAVGASRAAVDSGYAPNDWQVGQTGKVVAPNLYVAVGISGAIQHLAGMKDSKTIVAINKDSDAPIFELADYGLVADLFSAVPELTEGVKKAKQG